MKCKGCGAELAEGSMVFFVHQLPGGFLVSLGPLRFDSDPVKAAVAVTGSLKCADKCVREAQAVVRRRYENARWN
jgi:hypothetical protein